MSVANNILNSSIDQIQKGKSLQTIKDAEAHMTCQTAMGGTSSATENDIPAKEKDKSNSDQSMASFNNLQSDNRSNLQIADKKGSKPNSPEKKEKKTKFDLRHESPYALKDYPPVSNLNESKLKRKQNSQRPNGLDEPLTTVISAAAQEEIEKNLSTIQSARSKNRPNLSPIEDKKNGKDPSEK